MPTVSELYLGFGEHCPPERYLDLSKIKPDCYTTNLDAFALGGFVRG